MTTPPLSDILQLIDNQRREYSSHPFSAGRAGCGDFARLASRFAPLDGEALLPYLDLIDEVRLTHADCHNCTCKILTFCEIFTAHKLPARHAGYRELYDDLMSRSRYPDRDFRAEVREALHSI